MLDELPLVYRLQQRRPDLYDDSWTCSSCGLEVKTWPHLWSCSEFADQCTALKEECYLSLMNNIKEYYRRRFTDQFLETMESLSCWSALCLEDNSISFANLL